MLSFLSGRKTLAELALDQYWTVTIQNKLDCNKSVF